MGEHVYDERGLNLLRLPEYINTMISVVDLEDFSCPSSVELYEGLFSNNGVYRMVCSQSSRIMVVYGSVEIVPRCVRNFQHDDVYVEYFVRANERVIRVMAFRGARNKPVRYLVRTFLVDCVGPVECSDHAVSWMTDSPVSITLNLTPGVPIHPFIIRTPLIDHSIFGFVYSMAVHHRGYAINQDRSYMRNPYRMGYIYYHIDSDLCTNVNGKPLLVESHLLRVTFNKNRIEVMVLRTKSLQTYVILPIRRRSQ